MNKVKIVLIGETCDDLFIYGQVTRLCPEAPVPIFKPSITKKNDGMAGNVLSNLKSINKNCEITFFHQKNVIKKTRIVDEKSNQMIVRIDEVENNDANQFTITSNIINKIKNSDILIISDYNKGFLSDLDLIFLGKLSKLSILDSKRKLTKKIVNSFSFIKLNEHEYNNNKEITSDNIIVTLGSKGAMYKNFHYKSKNPKETIDVSGAGDTFTSSFILKYFECSDISQSIHFANKMSSIVVSKKGVSTP